MAVVEITKDNFEDVLKKHEILLLDFWAPWCGPCRMFGPVYEATAEENPDIAFGKVNTDEQEELAAGFEIRSIPTVAAFRQGILIFCQPGSLSVDGLDQLIAQVKALDMEKTKKELEKRVKKGKEANL